MEENTVGKRSNVTVNRRQEVRELINAVSRGKDSR
jgi:hypothetical protein